MNTENIVDKVMDCIKESPKYPEEIALDVGISRRSVDYAIQLILERGWAAPNLEWKLTPL